MTLLARAALGSVTRPALLLGLDFAFSSNGNTYAFGRAMAQSAAGGTAIAVGPNTFANANANNTFAVPSTGPGR